GGRRAVRAAADGRRRHARSRPRRRALGPVPDRRDAPGRARARARLVRLRHAPGHPGVRHPGRLRMIDELLAYYNTELAFLREMGAEFAARYPKVAARLMLEADKCEDPHVERILEGVAFLTARVRHKIDDEFPEITNALLGALYPHYQRPVPSMTVA